MYYSGFRPVLPTFVIIPFAPESATWSFAAEASSSQNFNGFRGFYYSKNLIASTTAFSPSFVITKAASGSFLSLLFCTTV